MDQSSVENLFPIRTFAKDTSKVGFCINRVFIPVWKQRGLDYYNTHKMSSRNSKPLSYSTLRYSLKNSYANNTLTCVVRKGRSYDIYYGYGYIGMWINNQKHYLYIRAVNSMVNPHVKNETFRHYLSSMLFTDEIFSIFHRRLLKDVIIPNNESIIIHPDLNSIFFDEFNLVKFKSFQERKNYVSNMIDLIAENAQ